MDMISIGEHGPTSGNTFPLDTCSILETIAISI